MMHLSKSSISAYESGERTPSLESIVKFATIYHCSCDFLLGISPQKPETILSMDGLSDCKVRALQYLINTMKSETQE